MAINQKQVLSLQQKLSPQQIQMIKLLELPTVQLEQRIKQEIEDNIVLEEEDRAAEDEEQPQQISVDEYLREDDTPSYKSRINNYSKDDKQRPVFLTEGRSLQEYLIEQLGFRNLSEREMKLAVYLVGSIDEDGYLRRLRGQKTKKVPNGAIAPFDTVVHGNFVFRSKTRLLLT